MKLEMSGIELFGWALCGALIGSLISAPHPRGGGHRVWRRRARLGLWVVNELNFAAALKLDALTQLKLVLDLAYEFLRNTGREMTPEECRAKMLKPGL